jgi:glycosyltransferase involved in cell wall biosynthesis
MGGMTGFADPVVSVVLPSFNRAAFLPEAFASIQAQTFTDWELIVVDDGSTDDTRRVVSELAARSPRPVQYHVQDNQGPAGARNTGARLACGRYLAFFDSDDLWLPHHVADCVAALDANPDVDWVYGSCRVVDLGTGRELQSSSFHTDGRLRPFMGLAARPAGRLKIITDARAAEHMIAHGLMCGLQCSVMRRAIFDVVHLPPHRIAEDQIFVVRVLKSGFTLAYFDDVHAVYRVHADSSSARDGLGALDKAVAGIRELIHAFEALAGEVELNPRESRTLQRRLADESFWTLGYSLLWKHGRHAEALGAFRQGLRRRPWNLWQWKTYSLALARRGFSQHR